MCEGKEMSREEVRVGVLKRRNNRTGVDYKRSVVSTVIVEAAAFSNDT